MEVPVIDLFAGPGGLGEGFSRYASHFSDQSVAFRVKLSIEKDPVAARTLRLRAFVRAFAASGRQVPNCYYDYVRAGSPSERKRCQEKMAALPEWEGAGHEAWNATLGEIRLPDLHARIGAAIAGHPVWILLGGPPCQAYSVVGRSRRMGIGEELRTSHSEEAEKLRSQRAQSFFRDDKHTLYREYLKIVAMHQPPIFVMENVKGILSSKLDGEYIFERILEDLRDPCAAVESDPDCAEAGAFLPARRRGYEIHSFVASPDFVEGEYARTDYLIRSQDFGVPQERQRVILLGIRDDLDLVPSKLEKQPQRTVSDVIGSLPRLRSGRSGRVTHKSRVDNTDTPARWVDAVRSSVTQPMLSELQQNPAYSSIHRRMKEILDNLDSKLGRGSNFVACSQPASYCEGLSAWFSDERLGGVLQHETRDHMDTDFARYLFVAVFGEVRRDSPKLRHFPETFLPDHLNAKTEEGRRIFHDRFRVQLAHRPATTVTCHIRKDGHYFIHYDPTQCRSLTVREAARIQTFPDNYFFEGNRTEQYEQVGNAVPPFLAVQLAQVVARLVNEQTASAGIQRTSSEAVEPVIA